MSLKERLIAEQDEARRREQEEAAERARCEAEREHAKLRPLLDAAMPRLFPGESYTAGPMHDNPNSPALLVLVDDVSLQASRINLRGVGECCTFRPLMCGCPTCGAPLWSYSLCYTRADIAGALTRGVVADHRCEAR